MNKLKTECSTTENIDFFICEFRKAFGDEELVKNVFTCGYCYHFANILENLFNGEIMYNPIDNHFAFMDLQHHFLWDINGKINNANLFTNCWYNWENYQIEDPIESKRIMEQCAYKL